MKIANQNAAGHVARREDFKGSNLYGETRRIKQDSFRELIREANGEPLEVYAVFSYGEHWPLFAFRAGVWYENKEKYSRTTSKQKGQARPWGQSAFVQVTCEELRKICGLK